MLGMQLFYSSLVKTAAALTASSEAAGFPASNVQNRWVAQAWRSTGVATTQWLKVNLGSAKSIYGVFLAGHNFSGAATIKIQGNSSDSWDAPPMDVSFPVASGIMALVWASAYTYQWYRLKIDDSSNPDGYVKVGVFWLGDRFGPTRQAELGFSYEFIDPSILNYSAGGQLSSVLIQPYCRRGYRFPNSPDFSSFKTMMDAIGVTRELFLVEDSAYYATKTYYVRVADFKVRQAFLTRFDIDIAFEDLL